MWPLTFVSPSADSRSVTGESMCTLVLVNCLGGLSLPRNSVVTLTDRPDITTDVFSNKAHCWKRHVGVDALVNLKTTSCQQLLYYDFVSAALCSTDDLPRKPEAHFYTKRHAKIIQCADNRCNREDSHQPARPLSRITSFFPILCTGRM